MGTATMIFLAVLANGFISLVASIAISFLDKSGMESMHDNVIVYRFPTARFKKLEEILFVYYLYSAVTATVIGLPGLCIVLIVEAF
jgi:hypothetical protein